MQTTFEQLEGLERKLTIDIPAQRVEEEVEKRLRAARPKLRVAGFRAGKVPPEILKQKYGAEIRREALSELIDSSYRQAIVDGKYEPVSNPEIEFLSGFAEGEGLKFNAIFEVMPEVMVRGLDDLNIELINTKVTDNDVNEMLKTLQRQQATFHDNNDKSASKDDRLTIDFVGRLDGVEFDGGSGQDVSIILGSGQMLPDFENALFDTKVGETKVFNVQFPENYHAENLSGKTAEFTATIKKVAEMKLPEIDEKFVKKFAISSGNLDEFKKAVRDNMEREVDNALRRIKRERLLDALAAANQEQVIAKAQIKQEVARLSRNMGLEKQIPDVAQREQLAQTIFADAARRNALLTLLFTKLFTERKLELNQDLVEKRLESIAATYENPSEVTAWYRQDANARTSLESSVLEEQLIDELYQNAKVTYVDKDFQELMAINNQMPR